MDNASQAIQPRSWSPGARNGPQRDPDQALKATEILDGLERFVVGQRPALREVSLLLAMHALGGGSFRAPNAIVIGPTGVGKTHTLSVASHALGLPFVATDATSLVPSGIVGEQVEDVLEGLARSAESLLSSARVPRKQDDDLELAGRGVVLVDEFDKLAAPEDGSALSRHAERRAIQRRLLKFAEGARLRVGIKQHDPGYRDRFIDTSGILLLVAGAFSGQLGNAWWGRGPGRSDRISKRAVPADIVEAGFIPELIGRLPVLIVFEPLTTADLVSIIDHDEVSPMASWRHYFDIVFHARLGLDEAAKWVIAERASGLGMGARGLQHVLFPVLSAKASEFLDSDGREEVVLRASDFMPAVALPTAIVVQ